MRTLANFSHVFGKLVIGTAAISSAIVNMSARAADKPDELPRYRLKTGQELQYHEQTVFKFGKEDNAGAFHTMTDATIWVIGANADGSWRLVVREGEKFMRTSGDEAPEPDKTPATYQLAACDLFPDGRVVVHGTNERSRPEAYFPRLPGSADALKKGWKADREDGFQHCQYTINPDKSSGNTWAFDNVPTSLSDKIYLSSSRSTNFFDKEKCLIARGEFENTQGYGFEGKGTGTMELTFVKDHDEAWTKALATDADRYFAAIKAHQDLTAKAGHDAEHAGELLARAEAELKDARPDLKQAMFIEQLDNQLSQHKNMAGYIAKEAKEIAEIKGKPAADWKLDDLDGKSHALADYRGKVVVLDFWYRGCGWCIRAMPQVQQLSEDFKNEPVAVLGMNNDPEEKDAKFVVDAMQLTYPVLKASGVPSKYNVHGFPTLVIIDQDGKVHDVHIGYSKTLRAEVGSIIKELLASAPAPNEAPVRAAEPASAKADETAKPKAEPAAPVKLPVTANRARFIPARQPNQTTTKGAMRIRVVDADGQPIPGAKIHEGVWTKEKDFKHNRDYVCDANGRAEIELPKTLYILRLWSRKDAYVPLFAHWEDRMSADQRVIPDEFTFSMQKGMAIGGVVKDENGKPVAGAKVEVMYAHDVRDQLNRLSNDIWLAEGDDAATTDAEGRWSLNDVPPGDETRIQVKLSHPDYVSDFDWGPAIRATTSHFAMLRGTRVTGTITAPYWKPVSGALVIWGNDPYLQNRPQQEVHSDEKGIYRFPPLPGGRMTVTVVAEGWMPQLRHVDIAENMDPVDFQLKPGKTLRIKFVDQSGNPVPGVGVTVAEWRGEKSLYNYKHPNVVESRIPRQADGNGIYEWTWAPDDAVMYSFYKQDRGAVTGISLTADGEEHIQKLPIPGN
jgi:peroxiredoxin/uncharacterized GH25 family protein